MDRIYVREAETELLEEINDRLDEAGIEYDFDSDNRYMVDEFDTDEALAIMEDVGADAELIGSLRQSVCNRNTENSQDRNSSPGSLFSCTRGK